MYKELESLDLTQNEITIYLFTLRNPQTTATQIRKETKIVNSRVYASLDRLITKGIVTYEITPKGKRYSAEDPEVLKEIISEKKKKIEQLVPLLKEMKNTTTKKTTTSVYEGFSGFKNSFRHFIERTRDKDTVDIIAFSSQAYKSENLSLALKEINKQAKKKNLKYRLLFDNNSNIYIKDRQDEGYQEIRVMPKGFVSPCSMDVSDSIVGIFVWGEEPYSFLIENEEVAKGFRTYFNFLWNLAQPYKE